MDACLRGSSLLAFVRHDPPSGTVFLWYGSIASIPDGYILCNGANGTPDLRDRFVVGAGSTYAVGDTGGGNHQHSIDSQVMDLADPGADVNDDGPFGDFAPFTQGHNHGGTTGEQLNLIPYLSLCYIMKS